MGGVLTTRKSNLNSIICLDMKIEIDYEGAIARCRIDGKLFSQCQSSIQRFAVGGLRQIVNNWEKGKV